MTIWFYSDPHFGQDFTKFGNSTRPPAEELDELMIERHNAIVKPQDHVYCLGDFAMRKEVVERIAPRLHGHKRLILGNHDIFDAQFYLKCGFKRLCAVRKFDNIPIWFTHFPIHPGSFGLQIANVHGHVHEGKPLFWESADPEARGFVRRSRYINVCVERINYTPVSLETITQWASRT